MYRTTQDRRQGDRGDLRDAARLSAVVAVAAVAVLVFAALWVSTCGESTVDTVACGTAQRTLLALVAPAILLTGGTWAFVRSYRAWREGGTWWPWQGAGWFLMTSTLLMLTISMPPIAGHGLGG